MSHLLEFLMEGETGIGFLMIIAFLLGAGVQSLPGRSKLNGLGSNLGRAVTLLEALSGFLGNPDERRKRSDGPPAGTKERRGPNNGAT